MKASKVKEALKMYDQLQAHIDKCDTLIEDLTPKPLEPVEIISRDDMWPTGGTLTIRIGGMENDLGVYLYHNIGPDIKRLVEDKRKGLVKEQEALEI